MKLGIMQPYFLPYIGYFQLIGAVDSFVVYDNIKYTKKGWINRNRLLLNGSDDAFSLPLKKGSDSLDIVEREISDSFDPVSMLNQFRGVYRKAPHFAPTYKLLEAILGQSTRNLFQYLRGSIEKCCEHLGITTKIIVSSSVAIDHSLKAQDKVIAICEALQAHVYINAIGGVGLYKPESFGRRGVELKFIRSREISYPQFGAPFVPWLSIVDVLMFNSVEEIRNTFLGEFELI